MRGGDATFNVGRGGEGVNVARHHNGIDFTVGVGHAGTSYAASSARRTGHATTGTGYAGHASADFDFNSTQPLPWREQIRPADRYEPLRETGLHVRKFAGCHDAELLAYLNMRNVSTGFLCEIDQFLQSHPEILTCTTGRAMIEMINDLPPVQAYRYFLKGYTRPARYNDGVVVSGDFKLPVGFRPASLRTKRDPELDDFFDGFEYRWDILDRIDREVALACKELSLGRSVPSGLRRLVCYVAWGNPIDAYKWFEYNYQEEYIPHRYLPEHVVLGDVPKPKDYTVPNPSALGSSRKHSRVRYRMARANDEGVDVLDVLLSEYRSALVRRGYRRKDIDDLCSKAKNRLDTERESPTGVDIVDMIMDDAVDRGCAQRSDAQRSRRSGPRTAAGRTARVYIRKMAAAPSQTPAFLRAQASELCIARHNLQKLYTMEEQTFLAAYLHPAQDIAAISYRRASAERRYANALIRYLRDSKQMTSVEAADLQRYFTRQKMEGLGPVNKAYLMGIYPRELS